MMLYIHTISGVTNSNYSSMYQTWFLIYGVAIYISSANCTYPETCNVSSANCAYKYMVWRYVYHHPIVLILWLAMYHQPMYRQISQLCLYRDLRCMVWRYVYHQPIVLINVWCGDTYVYHQPIVLIPLIVIAKSGPSLTRHNVSTENQKYVKTNYTRIKKHKKNQATICQKKACLCT